jgi:hypothetical protein
MDGTMFLLLSHKAMEGRKLHYSRIVGLVGVVLAAIGLLMQSASSAAEEAIPGGDGTTFMQATSSATGGAVPSSFDNVWGAIYGELAVAGIILALALIAIVALAFMPPMNEVPNRMYSLVLIIVGVIVIVVSGIAMNRAMGDATDLQNAYAQMAAAGALPAAFGVSISIGWVLLLVGGGVGSVAGILGLMADTDAEEAAAEAPSDE